VNLVFLGPPGAGKGTQAARYAERLGVPHVSTGDMLRRAAELADGLGRRVRAVIESGHLVSDEVMGEVVRERLSEPDAREGFLLDGYPRTLPQAEFLERLLAGAGRRLDAVVVFDVPVVELTRRLGLRGRTDDSDEAVRTRLEVYATTTRPLVEWYRGSGLLRLLDGTGGPDEVAARLDRLLGTGAA
jgi:adenylate kinase